MQKLTHAELNEMYKQALATAEAKYPNRYKAASMHEWVLALHPSKAALGTCHYTKKKITLSKWHILAIDKDRVMNTILHEVAHAICPKEGHSTVWKRVFKMMGGSGETRSSRAESLKNNTTIPVWKLINTLTGDVIASYYRKPSRDFSTCWLRNDLSTRGKLKLIKTGQHQQ